jgi:ArsR family transcriptional regulator
MSVKVLFLCSANSARSLMAEAILRQFAGDSVQAFSAGTAPTAPEQNALLALQSMGVSTDSLRSKTIAELGQHNFDYVISLCDRARSECQIDFQEHNFIAWDFPDPVAMRSNEAFKKTAQELSERIRMFLLIIRKRAQQASIFNAPQEFFKVLSDPLRLQIIMLLARRGEVCVNDNDEFCRNELCVNEVVEATQMSQPKVSRHLAQLREYGVVVDRKDVRFVYYRINPALPDWMRKVIETTAEHNPQFLQE